MTAIAAMAKSLLKGEVLSVMNCFKWFGITNCSREIGRGIERKFGVVVSRVNKETTSRYGQPCNYYEYRLNRTEHNKEGIERMIAYVSEIEQQEFKSIVRRGKKKVHVPENEPALTPPKNNKGTQYVQNDLFSLTKI